MRLKQENVLLKRALQHAARVLEHHRPQRGDAGRLPDGRDDRQDQQHGADHRRVGHRQGAGGARRSLQLAAREHPFVALNCGAVPETLLESELFGHMRGAFTGADTNKKGLIEVAERGTIFLDEIGEMNATMQVKLLRVLQDRRFRRLGGTEEVQADIRVIAATNQDLPKIVAEGRFREDLFYRINVIPIHLPPLRDRREDIPLLAEHFLAKFASRWASRCTGFRTRRRSCWPPTRGRATSASSRTSSSAPWRSSRRRWSWRRRCRRRCARVAAPRAAGRRRRQALRPRLPVPRPGRRLRPRSARRGVLPPLHRLALERAGGVQTRAAEMLGMSFRSFRYYAKKFNVR